MVILNRNLLHDILHPSEWRQTITWTNTNTDLLSIWPPGTNFSKKKDKKK